MIYSLTGYGSGQHTENEKTATCEIRSVNHKYFDCTIKAPKIFGYIEEGLKAYLQQKITRGKLDVYITIDVSKAEQPNIILNENVLAAYLAVFSDMSSKFNITNNINATYAASLPDVLKIESKSENTDEIAALVKKAADIALDALLAMRAAEGEKLLADIKNQLIFIGESVNEIDNKRPFIVSEYREKIEKRIKELISEITIDENRLITETAFFADKIAIDEEIIRLKSHLSAFNNIIYENNAIGRKLDFLVQEINREINTIGSKISDADIALTVVNMKSTVEKIREQIQNLE